jgi:WD40 repeat protein
LPTGATVAVVSVKNPQGAFFDQSGTLWSIHDDAMHRWPVQYLTNERQYVVGPPARMFAYRRDAQFACDSQGRVLVMDSRFTKEGAEVFIRNEGSKGRLSPQYDVRHCAVSPDGRWAATGSHWEDNSGIRIKIWEIATRKLVKELTGNQANLIAGFSPDGRFLATSICWEGHSEEARVENFCRLWQVGTWEESKKTIPGVGTIFWKDDIMADGLPDGTIRLYRISTGEKLASIASPDITPLHPSQLVAGYLYAQGRDNDIAYVWDLYRIRRQLRELGLDWDGPPNLADIEELRAGGSYKVRVNREVVAGRRDP